MASADDPRQVEGVALTDIARVLGTPCYVYSRQAFETAWQRWSDALAPVPHRICYAVKANSNLSILALLNRLGASFDIVSGGELERVLRVGTPARRVVFSGVGKSVQEIRRALEVGIGCFNVESLPELVRLSDLAVQMKRTAPVSLRINPDVDAATHPYISTGLKANKFGIPHEEALAAYHMAAGLPGLDIVGIDCHIGSQMLDPAPLQDAFAAVVRIVDALADNGIHLRHIDMGGGIGIAYEAGDKVPALDSVYQPMFAALKDRHLELWVEPGRSIAGAAGTFLTRVEFIKDTGDKHFVIVDGGMNDLIRPALYSVWQNIRVVDSSATRPLTCDVVGPICETGDFLGKNRSLCVNPGDLLRVDDAGAYGFVMASNYNSRPRAPEVLVDGTQFRVIRRRETLEELLEPERITEASPA
jgi:diaminopimelate decarboxylase